MDRVKALHLPTEEVVDVIQDGPEHVFIKFPSGKAIWVSADLLDFNYEDDGLGLGGDDDWGPENTDDLGFGQDHYDIEYDRP